MVERVTIDDIVKLPHWKTVIRPAGYEAHRLPLEQLESTVAKLQVQLRGWYFPHLPHNIESSYRGSNHIEMWSNFEHFELWRFYQSAQLIHLITLRENMDHNRKAVEDITGRHLNWQKTDLSGIGGYVDIIRALYHIADVFEFASRLVAHLSVSGNVSIQLALAGAKSYILTAWDENRSWDYAYIYRAPLLEETFVVNAQSLIADSGPHALAAVQRVFFRFGWEPSRMAVLSEELRKYRRQ